MKITKEELKKMMAEGAFLQERLKGNTLIFEKDKTEEKRFGLWQKKAGGSGGEAAFVKRLEAEDISVDRAKKITNTVAWNEDSPIPSWGKEANCLLEMLPVDKNEIQEKLKFNLEVYLQSLREKIPDQENVLEEIKETMLALLPFLYYGEKELFCRIKQKMEYYSPKALDDMSTMLARGLYYLIHKVLAEKLGIFILRKESFDFLLNMKEEDKKRYRVLFTEDLLSGGWKEIFIEYPVLVRFMTTIINNWVNNMEEMTAHLENDRKLLNIEFNQGRDLGKVQFIHGNISDAHNKGKGVMILHFESGTKIVYKPRNLGIDISFDRLVKTLHQMTFPYELKAPQVVAAKDHGWVEFIEYRELNSLEEAKIYYQRAGALLCLVYVLGGNDFHGENIIASGAQPVLVDLETIISYKMIQFHKEYEEQETIQKVQNFIDLTQESVLGIGFLPVWINANDISVDFGALTGSIPTSIPGYKNDKVKVFAYDKELIEGFQKAYDFLYQKKDVLQKRLSDIFQDAMLRIILRPTNVYSRMLYHSLDGQFLKDGFTYSVEMERFAPAYLIKVGEDKVKRLWPVFLAEREALEGRDIPIFYGYVDQRHIRSNDTILCRDYFAHSAMERVWNNLQKLDESDRDRQLDFISESLKIYLHGCHNEGEKVTVSFQAVPEDKKKEEKLLLEARTIYEEIVSQAVKLDEKNNSWSWISYQHDLIHERTFISQSRSTLYDGLFGIALFAAALSSVTKEEKIREWSLQLLKPFLDNLKNQVYPMPVYRIPTGLGSGLGGMFQAMLLIGDYTKEKYLQQEVLYLVEKITEDQLKKDKYLNIYNGVAGLIPGLLNCYERTGQKQSLELAKICGKKIIKDNSKVKKNGWGDGKAGLAYALAKLYQHTKEAEIHASLLEIANEAKSWYADLQLKGEKGMLQGSLCSGMTGLGFLGLALREAGVAEVGLDLEMIIREVQEYPLDYGDHFCCGNSGRLDFLLEAGLRLNKPELVRQVNQDIGRILARKNALGHYQITGIQAEAVNNPSFFQGLSGIGYMFLRNLEPDRIHSILV